MNWGGAWGKVQPLVSGGRKTYDVRNYGCVLDGFVFYGGSATNGSNVVNVSDASFQAGRDEGKYLRIVAGTQSASPVGALRGRIISVNSPTQVTLDTAALATFTGSGIYGTDDTAPFLSALAAASLTGGEVLVPVGNATGTMTGHGILRHTTTIVIPDGVTLMGEGADYGKVQDPPNFGSGLYMLNYLPGIPFLQLGDGGGASIAPGNVAPKMRDIAIDAMRLTSEAVYGNSRRAEVRNCTIWRGSGGALVCGPDGWYVNNKCGQQNEGSFVIKVQGDCHVLGGVARQAGLNGSQVLVAAQDAKIGGGLHIFSGGGGDVAGSSLASTNMTITNPTSSSDGGLLTISGVIFDSTYGAHIKIVNNGSRTINAVTVAGNHFFSGSNVPQNTFPVVDLAHGSGSTVRALTFADNAGNGGIANDTTYSAMVAKSGAGTVVQFSTDNNHFSNCQQIFSGIRPDAGVGENSVLRGTGLGGTTYYSRQSGTATLSGTGAQNAFTIAHGLDATPVDIVVTAGSAAARGDFHVTADAANLTINYAAAPASGTNNVVLYWRAGL